MNKKIITFLALVIAVLAVAFTKSKDNRLIQYAESKRLYEWFLYIGPRPATSSTAKRNYNYRTLNGAEIITVECPGSIYLCAISAENDGTGKPIISPLLQNDINNYFANPSVPPSTIKEKN